MVSAEEAEAAFRRWVNEGCDDPLRADRQQVLQQAQGQARDLAKIRRFMAAVGDE